MGNSVLSDSPGSSNVRSNIPLESTNSAWKNQEDSVRRNIEYHVEDIRNDLDLKVFRVNKETGRQL